MLTNTYECQAIILRSLRLVANCIRKPIRLIFATFWRICREYIFLHSQGNSPQCESIIRDNYLRQFRKSKNQSDYELFMYHRNQVKYKKEKDKSQYYINVVNENKNRPKKTMANFERGRFIDQMQNKRK